MTENYEEKNGEKLYAETVKINGQRQNNEKNIKKGKRRRSM